MKENDKSSSFSNKLWRKANGTLGERLKVAFAILAVLIIVALFQLVTGKL